MKSTITAALVATLVMAAGAAAQTVDLPWHVNDRGGGMSTAGGVTLRSSIGQPAVQAGASSGVNLEEGFIPGLRFYSGAGEVTMQTEERWNLLSVPLAVDDFRKTVLYPAATSAAFIYSTGYQPEDTLRLGAGFWLKFDSSVTVPFTGSTVAVETVDVLDKWNIIGPLSYPLPASNIQALPPASISSNYFGYSGSTGYAPADTLQPGYGYWVKVSGAGRIVLSTSPVIPPAVSAAGRSPSPLPEQDAGVEKSSITFRDALGRERAIWFVSSPGAIDPKKWQLPPLPPAGVMDVRYASDLMLESAGPGPKVAPIRVTSAVYPLTVTWKAGGHDDAATILADERQIALSGSGTAILSEPPVSLKLRITPSAGPALPSEFALRQNYPNPFNASTLIRYELPVGSRVAITVFNLLGQEMTTLVDEVQEAGFKILKWDAGEYPSGVYFCHLRAGDFVQTRKLVLMK